METTNNLRGALVKVFSIIGLIALVALLAWALVQAVRILPDKFSSLANIAETVNEYRPQKELTVTLPKNIVNSGETIAITWNDVGDGTYTFSYACQQDIQISVRTSEGTLQPVACDTKLSVSEKARGLFISVVSKVQRFSDVAFSVTFEPESGEAITKESRVTVVNATVPQEGTVVVKDTPKKEEPKTEPKPKPVATPKPAVAQPKPVMSTTPVIPQPQVVTYFPVSVPNGYTDLKMTYLGTGVIQNGIFIPKSNFDEDDTVAFQFEVQNIGTKTSDRWAYELELPGGEEYNSASQPVLLPQEREIFTVRFDMDETSRRSVTLTGTLEVRGDNNSRNDSFEKTVHVID